MTTFKGFAWLVLAASIATALSAETHCPGNVESVPLHFVNGYQLIVSVSVNHSAPTTSFWIRTQSSGSRLQNEGVHFQHFRDVGFLLLKCGIGSTTAR